jgi:bis(5'-nucleosidyl)-tetraphosphatase
VRARTLEAGAVVFRSVNSTIQLLVVRSSDEVNWLFPKGHIEAGETAEEAALRETREEAGVDGRSVAPLGSTAYTRGSKQLSVEFFLVEYLGPAESDEARDQRWCTCDEALHLLSFENLKPIAKLACRMAHARCATRNS